MTKDELKKEATEYALEWGDKTDGTYACCRDGYLVGAEPREKRIAELEKENGELKEKLEILTLVGNVATKGLDKQLTKAKEIIEKLLNVFASNDFFEEEELDAMAEAEQFLKEVSE